MTEPLIIDGKQESPFKKKLMEPLPNGANLNLCLTCGTCASGCPCAHARSI